MSELEIVKAENERLKGQLAAIRDAGDEEIEDLAREAGNGIGADYYQDKSGCREAEECLDRLKDIAKDRGLRIAELEKEIERDHIRFRNATEDLIRERDEAVGLLKHLTRRSLIRKDVEVLATLGDENAKRILELIGEGE